MLGPLVLDRIGGDVHRTDVVTVDQRALGERNVELGEELPEPGSLSDAVSHSAVFRLGTRAGDDWLTFGRPRHQVAAQKDGVARGGAPSVRTPGPVDVSVDNELGGGRPPVKEEAEVDGAAEIVKDPLESSEVWLPGIMHMETYL
jgi:hypothetical protein